LLPGYGSRERVVLLWVLQGTGLEATIQKEPTLLSDADSAAVIAYLQLFR